MSDITMCSGVGCDLKDECYRHTAKKSNWQYWFSEVPLKDGKCDMFWDNEEIVKLAQKKNKKKISLK